MPANHCQPHTAEARHKMRLAHAGKPRPWRQRESVIRDGETLWRCGKCKEFLKLTDFYKNNRTVLGITSECKSCHRATAIASRDPEVTRANGRRNEANRRARKAQVGGRLVQSDIDVLLRLLGRKCLNCRSAQNLQLDHIIPLSKGGAHHPANIQPLCRRCNEQKQTHTADYRTVQQQFAVLQVWVVEFKKI